MPQTISHFLSQYEKLLTPKRHEDQGGTLEWTTWHILSMGKGSFAPRGRGSRFHEFSICMNCIMVGGLWRRRWHRVPWSVISVQAWWRSGRPVQKHRAEAVGIDDIRVVEETWRALACFEAPVFFRGRGQADHRLHGRWAD